MPKKILLDMDGVLADFVSGACKYHNVANPYTPSDGPRGNSAWEILEYINIPKEEFWSKLGFGFWENLPLTPESLDLYDMCVNAVGRWNICAVTSPCWTFGCCDGKISWAKKNFPEMPVFLSVCSLVQQLPPKYFFAHREVLLIDDNYDNCMTFTQDGGMSFCFPRPWNRFWNFEDKALELCSARIQEFLGY